MLKILSQSVSQIDKFAVLLILVYRHSQVFLLVATADMVCLSPDEVNGSFNLVCLYVFLLF